VKRTARQLIIQFEINEADTFESLYAIEETLIQAFSQNRYADVDGHDIGQGRFNIFIIPNGAWGPVIERVEAFLKLRKALDRAVIAKSLPSGLRVIRPADYSGTFEF